MELNLKSQKGSIVPGRNRNYKESALLGLLAMATCLGFTFLSPFMFLALAVCFPLLGFMGLVRIKPNNARPGVPSPREDWMHTTDAREWARAFIQKVRESGFKPRQLDEDLMLGWFANAMSTALDEGYKQGYGQGYGEAEADRPREPMQIPTPEKQEPVFRDGRHVRWTSQAAGSWKTKEGDIVAVVPARVHPRKVLEARADLAGLSYDFGTSLSRNHESYLVRVKGHLYWPRVAALEVMEPATKA